MGKPKSKSKKLKTLYRMLIKTSPANSYKVKGRINTLEKTK